MPRLESIQVGQPKTYGDVAAVDPSQQQWRTGFFKYPVSGPCQVTSMELEGDGQADLINHGGPDKAILAYSADHYPRWREFLQLPEMNFGGFGENLTISSVTEEDICIGDQWSIGTVLLQVSQPRQPCWKMARRWQLPELPKMVVKTGWCGWYLRVLNEGLIEAGMDCVLQKRPHPDWSISRANQALYNRDFQVSLGEELCALPELSGDWRDDLQGRLSLREL